MEVLASITANLIIYTLLLTGLNNFVVGKTNIWPVGHMAFFGIGAMVSGVLIADWNISAGFALVSGILAALVVSVLVGLTTLRLAGDYFIILSIGLCELVRAINVALKGPAGISGIRRPLLHGISLENDWTFIFVVLLPIFLLAVFLARRFFDSSLERICRLVRQDETAAKLLGISPLYYKVGCFAIGSVIAALAGGLYTLFTRSTDPATITIYQSILVFAIVLIGGLDSIRGSIIAGIMLVTVPRILEYFLNSPTASYYSTQVIQLFYGILAVVVIRFMPEGIVGTSAGRFYSAEK